jgi:hypothetical protein
VPNPFVWCPHLLFFYVLVPPSPCMGEEQAWVKKRHIFKI